MIGWSRVNSEAPACQTGAGWWLQLALELAEVVAKSFANFVELPYAASQMRWCGEGPGNGSPYLISVALAKAEAYWVRSNTNPGVLYSQSR